MQVKKKHTPDIENAYAVFVVTKKPCKGQYQGNLHEFGGLNGERSRGEPSLRPLHGKPDPQ